MRMVRFLDMDMNDNRKYEVLDAVRIALLGEVAPTLRRVMVDWEESSMDIRFYYDGPISDDDAESAECIVTELIAIFPADHRIDYGIERLDFPAIIPPHGACAYSRREYVG